MVGIYVLYSKRTSGFPGYTRNKNKNCCLRTRPEGEDSLLSKLSDVCLGTNGSPPPAPWQRRTGTAQGNNEQRDTSNWSGYKASQAHGQHKEHGCHDKPRIPFFGRAKGEVVMMSAIRGIWLAKTQNQKWEINDIAKPEKSSGGAESTQHNT